MLELIAEHRLPHPRFICSEVGTEILDLRSLANLIGQAYVAQVPSSWNLEDIYQRGLGDGICLQEFDSGQPRWLLLGCAS